MPITYFNTNNNRDHYFAPPSLHFDNFNIFGGLYITQSNICDGSFIVDIVSR